MKSLGHILDVVTIFVVSTSGLETMLLVPTFEFLGRGDVSLVFRISLGDAFNVDVVFVGKSLDVIQCMGSCTRLWLESQEVMEMDTTFRIRTHMNLSMPNEASMMAEWMGLGCVMKIFHELVLLLLGSR